jgi:hypothetical protein
MGPKWYAIREKCFAQMGANLKLVPKLSRLFIDLGIDDCGNQAAVQALLEKALVSNTCWSPKVVVKLVQCSTCKSRDFWTAPHATDPALWWTWEKGKGYG